MLSVKKIHASSAGAAAKYFAGYYAEAGAEAVGDSEGAATGEPPGRWHGPGAEKLGLAGNISKADLEAILSGAHPKTGEQLLAQQKDRTAGGRELKAIAARDLTFSAPKSVSAVWAAGSEAQRAAVTEAHNRAVATALEYLRDNGMRYPTGHSGGGGYRKGDAVVALFEHSTSRANDPQLHTHALIFFGVREDGQIKRIDFDMAQIHAAGAAYRTALASELQRQGFGIERVDPRQGFFRIAGTSESLVDFWSKRRKAVEQALEAEGRTDAIASAKAAVSTRAGKENPNRSSNFERWAEEARQHGFGPEVIEALRQRPEVEIEPGKTDEELVAEAMDKTVVMSDAKLARVVLADSVGRYSFEDAIRRVERIRASLVRLEREKNGRKEVRLTTQAVLDREARIVVNAQALADSRAHAIRTDAVEAAIAEVNANLAKKSPGASMTAEQVAMVRGATDGRGLVLVQGHAGAGKTFTLAPVVDLYLDRGYQVLGTSTSGKAAQVLGRDAGIDAETIAALRLKVEAGTVRLDDRTVLIVDEAGMVSSADMDFMLGEARASGAKVILVGDTEQLSPVEAGRPFEDLQKTHGALELSEVRRQKDEADRELGRLVRDGKVEKAVEHMRARDQWHVGGSVKEARAQVAQAYAERRARGEETLMVAAKRADVRALNEAARQALRDAGVIRGREVEIQTEAGIRAFARGDRVLFRKNDALTETRNGSLGDIERIDAKTMVVRLTDGRRIELALDHAERAAKAEEKAKKIEKEIAKLRSSAEHEWKTRHIRSATRSVERLGSKLMDAFDPPSRDEVKKRIKETEKRIEADQARREARRDAIKELYEELSSTRGSIRALRKTGEVLANIDHGHAITVHKSQGETLRQLAKAGGDVLCFARGSFQEFRRMLYVALTRNEGKAHIFMAKSAEAEVIEAFGRTQEKESTNSYKVKEAQSMNESINSRVTSSVDRTNVRTDDPAAAVKSGEANADVIQRDARSDDTRTAEADVRRSAGGPGDDWRADEEQRWRERQRALEERAREGRERWERDALAERERRARLRSGRVLDPVEQALARAHGAAEAAALQKEAEQKMARAERLHNLGARHKGGDETRPPQLTVDRGSFEQAAVDRARIAKEHEEARKSVQYVLARERSDREDVKNMSAIMMEVHRLKTSPDARERLRGEMLEEMQTEIDRRHASGDVGGARYARSLLVDAMAQDRDRFERERETADARNVIEAKQAIERMRASPDPAVREAGEQATRQLAESENKQRSGDVAGARVDREKLVESLREQAPERAQKTAREVSELAPQASPKPEVSSTPTPKTAPPTHGRSDGPEMDHA